MRNRGDFVSILTPLTSLDAAVPSTTPVRIDSVSHCVIGGEALHVAALASGDISAYQRRLINDYGPTETTSMQLHDYRSTDRADEACDVPIGRPIWNTRVYVLDGGLGACSCWGCG